MPDTALQQIFALVPTTISCYFEFMMKQTIKFKTGRYFRESESIGVKVSGQKVDRESIEKS
ncbi:hypothetical protein BD414DRAFT_479212 [Trametes punicea]|nr:hypothetical protein BD414DRAFT_479212 [Trametes punicea]